MRTKTAFLSLLVVLLQGCISTHTYLDPQFAQANYSDLKRVEPPYALSVQIETQLNGKPRATSRTLIDRVNRSLRATGVIVPYEGTSPADGQLHIVANDIGNVGAAVAKGFGTGLTFGLAGSHVTDQFDIQIRLTDPSGVTERQYQPALVSTVGLASAPEGLTQVPTGQAGNQFVDEVVLNFVHDLQAHGKLLPRH